MSKGQRRLAAIMFTDMVGYTALGQKNEALSIALVEEQRKLIRPILSRHNGREVKMMGDAFLVEFPNAVDATRCAYDIQRATREFNLSFATDKRIHLRIGVHVGEIVESQRDIAGDAVNVASRIEPLAEDGGVCITRQVYDHVRNKVDLTLSSIGAKSLKNVTEPIEIFKMVMPWEREMAGPSPQLDTRRVAILPFANMSPDPTDAYFADGMTEELISTMSKIGELSVISRTSIMQFKEKSKPVVEIAKELKAGTMLEGSVRKAGNRIRVTIQMIDAANDKHLWVESYDRDLQDIFAIQSEIAQRASDSLKVQLLSGERKDIGKIQTENSEAYESYLRGRQFWNERTREGLGRAVEQFETAIEADPKFALAYGGLADCYIIYSDYGWLRPREGFQKAKEYALKAIEIDPRLSEPHASLAQVYTNYEWKWPEAEREFKLAMELKPSYTTAIHWYALHFLEVTGRYQEAFDEFRRASLLDPLSRLIGLNLGVCLLILGKVDEGIEQLQKVVASSPSFVGGHHELGFAYYLDSRNDEAVSELRKAVDLSGGDPGQKADLACILGFVGRREEANRLIEEIKEISKERYVSNGLIAGALLGAGRKDEGFEYLRRDLEEKSVDILIFRTLPWFREFRADPRWVAFERLMGLR